MSVFCIQGDSRYIYDFSFVKPLE